MALNTNSLTVAFAGYAPGVRAIEYTVPSASKFVIKEIWVANTDTSSHTVTIRVVKNGQSTSTAYELVSALPLAANTSTTSPSMYIIDCNTMMDTAGDFIDVVADTGSKVAVRISGVLSQ